MSHDVIGINHVERPGYSPTGLEYMRDRKEFPSRRTATERVLLLFVSLGVGAYAAWLMVDHAALPFLSLCAVAFAGGLLSTWSPCGYSSLSLLRPAGHYSARAVLAWTPTLLAHGLGYLVAALLLGGVLGLVAWMLPTDGLKGWSLLMLGILAVGYGMHQLRLLSMPYPQRRAQVPHDARNRFAVWKIGLLYGFSLGLNFLTYVRTPILYVIVLAALLSGSVNHAIALLLALNLGRFAPLLVNALPVHDWAVQRWLASHAERAISADAIILCSGGAALVTWGLA